MSRRAAPKANAAARSRAGNPMSRRVDPGATAEAPAAEVNP